MSRYQSFAFVDLAGRHGEDDYSYPLKHLGEVDMSKLDYQPKDRCWAYGEVTTWEHGKIVGARVPTTFLPGKVEGETNEYFPNFVEHDEEYAEDCDDDDWYEEYEEYYEEYEDEEDDYDDDDDFDSEIEDDFDPHEN